ncbi:MAG: hypothetical protein JEZ09_07740 [Salinivirgaceae bacterium]|nr:hypothetical protein [Salinivirgaceae bacterium]
MKQIISLIFATLLLFGCTNQIPMEQNNLPNISKEMIQKTSDLLVTEFGLENKPLITKGIKHAASLWRTQDGTPEEFQKFCDENFFKTKEEKTMVFAKLEKNFETLNGNLTQINVGLNKNLALNNGELHNIDKMFAGYSSFSHLKDDFYRNKIAFVIALNFPYYSLQEKEQLGQNWTKQEWAWARMGDYFSSRVPAELSQNYSKANTDADIYISEYNIYMGSLVNNENEKLFAEDMVLLTHWNLRDEIKSNYSNSENGIEKQSMVYDVMKRIIDQTIPKEVINSGKNNWNPQTNTLFNNGKEIQFNQEDDERYQQIINSFHALQAMDTYNPVMDTYIKRNFSGSMEISQAEVETLFHEFLTSPQVKQVGDLIKKRLGRDLKPYDIWYDGFKSRSSISEDLLNEKTTAKYPNAKAFEADMPNMLQKLGWDKDRANFLASKITVEAARGSGHALGAEMKDMYSYLRTRVPATGMNYKGYNIAVHEFGHNVEQTISLHDVPFYSLHGIPNTAFTEALAFIFQSRDLKLLGINDPNPDKDYLKTVDTFWSIYEIMGVSMVDMKVWKWLYANPNATASELKLAVINISKEVWNTYYAEVFGMQDEPILAIYSHMIAYPLYLSAYSFGHLIDFQIEQYLKGKDFAKEVERIYSIGRLTPQQWMMEAVGEKISNKPILNLTEEAVTHFN